MLQVELDGISAQDLGLRKPDPAGSHFGHAVFQVRNVLLEIHVRRLYAKTPFVNSSCDMEKPRVNVRDQLAKRRLQLSREIKFVDALHRKLQRDKRVEE